MHSIVRSRSGVLLSVLKEVARPRQWRENDEMGMI